MVVFLYGITCRRIRREIVGFKRDIITERTFRRVIGPSHPTISNGRVRPWLLPNNVRNRGDDRLFFLKIELQAIFTVFGFRNVFRPSFGYTYLRDSIGRVCVCLASPVFAVHVHVLERFIYYIRVYLYEKYSSIPDALNRRRTHARTDVGDGRVNNTVTLMVLYTTRRVVVIVCTRVVVH